MENILECPICLARFDNNRRTPRLLPCQHNICSDCLLQLKATSKTQNSSFKCPECRRSFSSNLELIPKSLVICQLMDLSKSETQNTQKIEQLRTSFRKENATGTVTKPWSVKNYLKSIFDEIDLNGDGALTANELQNVLENVNSNTKFDPKTILLLMKIHDRNGDNEISFDEFYELHNKLNEDLETFLITDTDSSGGIDQYELSQLLQTKRYNLSRNFFIFFFNNLSRMTGKKSIEFDIYIRVSARLEYLLKCYHTNNYYY
ncbi:Programmed cell death 6, partial [Brachionus plicatilis]